MAEGDAAQSSIATYRCTRCGNERDFNPNVAPDEPACPKCWQGWDGPYPVMRRVVE